MNKKIEKRPLIMGVDPGYTGAITVFDAHLKKIIDIIDIPTTKYPKPSSKRGYGLKIDAPTLAIALDTYATKTALAVLEEPGAMPKQGLSSTFNFGHTCGLLHGILSGLYIPVMPVKPAIWKAKIGVSYEKKTAISLANKIFPTSESMWTLKKHHDRAESALLVYYGLNMLGIPYK